MSLAQTIRQSNADQTSRAAAGDFLMLARSLLAGGTEGTLGALEAAKASRATDRVQAILKAAVTAGTTTDTSALVGYESVANGFLESLRNDSAYQFILSAGSFRQVPFRSRLGIITTGASGSRVGELGRKPITRLSVTGDTLNAELKAVAIIVVSNELARFSGPIGNALFAGELRGAVAEETDAIFFAELLGTGVPSQGTGGGTAANAWSDLAFLFASVPMTSRSSPYFVGGPVAVGSLALRNSSGQSAFPALGVTGGEIAGVPVLVSDGVDENQLVLLDANKIVVADAGITLDSSRHATLSLSDDGTGAQSSLWQQNMTGLKAERIFAMHPLTTDAVAAITGIGAS